MKYTINKKGKYFVAQSLGLDISSFGESKTEAIQNLGEAIELYFEETEANEEQHNLKP